MSIKKEDKKYITEMLNQYLVKTDCYISKGTFGSGLYIKKIKDPEKDLKYYNLEKERIFEEYLKSKDVRSEFLKYLIENTSDEKMYYVYKYIKRNEPSYQYNDCLNAFKNNKNYDTGYRYSNYMYEVFKLLDTIKHKNDNLYYYIINDTKFIIEDISKFFKIFNNLSIINKKKTIDFVIANNELLENINFKNILHTSIKNFKFYDNYKEYFQDLNLDNKEKSFDINKISNKLNSNEYEIDIKYFAQFLKNDNTVNEFIMSIDDIDILKEVEMLKIKSIHIESENNTIKKIYINHLNDEKVINGVVNKYIEMSLDKTIKQYSQTSKKEELKKVLFEEILKAEIKVNVTNNKINKI